MAGLRSEISSFNALLVFEAAARAKNFTRAAEQLGLTRVSISRQISALEQELGVKLFVREHRRTTLTEAGRELADIVGPNLTAIAEAKRRIRNRSNPQRITVTTTVAFATYWLLPRLSEFGVAEPEIDLNLVISDKYLDLDEENIDLAIRYGAHLPRGVRSWRLFKERLFPVYSPKYRARSALEAPEDFLGERLLHLSGAYKPEAKWPNWFRVHGLEPPNERNGIVVDAYSTMIQAAVEGQGVALCGFPLVNAYLANGLLLRPETIEPLDRERFYLLNARPDKASSTAFADWILKQSAGSADL